MDNKAFCSDENVEQQQIHDRLHHHQDQNPQISPISSSLNNTNDEAFEESCLSSFNSESQPININRRIFYTEDIYNNHNHEYKSSCLSLDNKKDLKHAHHRYNDNNHNKKSVSFLDSSREFFRFLLPSNLSPSHITSKSIFVTWLQTLFPIFYWLPNYDIKHDLFSDVIAGCTSLALHIPQGLAYARLAGVEPINGLYVSLFPVIIYAVFGTSKQVSIGTFAVISIACKSALESFDLNQDIIPSLNDTHQNVTTTVEPVYNLLNAIDVLTTLCLFVGIIQFLLGFLQLGIMSIILSDTLISAFVTACSIHVFTSQIFALVDIDSNIAQSSEIPIPFDIIKSWISFITRIPQANLTTMLISTICIAILVTCKYCLEPYIIQRFKLKNLVIPIDILVIVIATMISAYVDLNGNYQVKIIPNIPKAFEGMPKVPDLSYFGQLYSSAILITFVSYISTYSLGKMYAKQHGYEVSANQELIALGVANIVSSFFLCYPCSGSLARSAVMDKVGARTQMASIVASILMIFFLLFFSGYLHTLPKSVLSCIIVVALYSTMKQIKQVKSAWYTSKLDGVLWMTTFIFVILFGVGYGLLYSVIFSFVILIIQLSIPVIKLKRQVKGSELFIEIEHMYDIYDPSTGLNIFKSNDSWIVFEFQGPLIFINSVILRRKFHTLIERYLIDQKVTKYRKISDESHKSDCKTSMNSTQTPTLINTIIFDCTRLTYIDKKGMETLIDIIKIVEKHGSRFVLAAYSQIVFESLKKNRFFDNFNIRQCYMSVVDAIADIKHNHC